MPEYPKIANDVFMLLLDGKLRSKTETLKYLKPLSPPPPPPPPAPVKRGRVKGAVAAADKGKVKGKGKDKDQVAVVPGAGAKPEGKAGKGCCSCRGFWYETNWRS